MIVWKYRPFFVEGMLGSYDEISVADDDEWRTFRDNWVAGVRDETIPKMKLASLDNTDGDLPYKKSDFPFCTTEMIIFSERAVEEYSDLLKRKAKYLPIECDCNDRYYVVDVPIIDCLDFEKSVIAYSKCESGAILGIDRYAFKYEMIANQLIFQIPESKRAEIFVTDKFIERAKDAGLVGATFIKMWDSETGTSYNHWRIDPDNEVRLG